MTTSVSSNSEMQWQLWIITGRQNQQLLHLTARALQSY